MSISDVDDEDEIYYKRLYNRINMGSSKAWSIWASPIDIGSHHKCSKLISKGACTSVMSQNLKFTNLQTVKS